MQRIRECISDNDVSGPPAIDTAQMKLGLQGVSIVIASGDSGVAARGADDGNADGCLGTGQVL